MDKATVVAQMGELVEAHKRLVGQSLRLVRMTILNDEALYAHTGVPEVLARAFSLASQLADELDPPGTQAEEPVPPKEAVVTPDVVTPTAPPPTPAVKKD